ncbi:MAG TPA: RNA methyltransferase [Gemmatimonadales bacterium]|nr:RNA methyltransferase [Gemmatimonadales bacterium]
MPRLLTTIRDLQRRKAREKRGLALAEGVRLVEEALAAGVTIEGAAVGPALEATDRGRALKAALAAKGTPLEPLGDIELEKLADTDHPQGIIAVIEPRSWSLTDLTQHAAPSTQHTVLVLDGVQDPGNVGAILRSALALGAAGVIALPGTADLLNSKVLRASMGAAFKLPNLHATDQEFRDWAAGAKAAVWTTAMDGTDLTTARRPTGPLAVLLGNEGAGVRADLAATAALRVTIPITPGAESLNVAAAAAILLWECSRAG